MIVEWVTSPRVNSILFTNIVILSFLNEPRELQNSAVDDKFSIVDINVVNYDIGPLTTIYLTALIITAIFAISLISTLCSTFL
jgi:hypothetical protein